MAQIRALVESAAGVVFVESTLTQELHRRTRYGNGHTVQTPIRAKRVEFACSWGESNLQVQDGTPRAMVEAVLKTVLDQLYAEPPAEPGA